MLLPQVQSRYPVEIGLEIRGESRGAGKLAARPGRPLGGSLAQRRHERLSAWSLAQPGREELPAANIGFRQLNEREISRIIAAVLQRAVDDHRLHRLIDIEIAGCNRSYD